MSADRYRPARVLRGGRPPGEAQRTLVRAIEGAPSELPRTISLPVPDLGQAAEYPRHLGADPRHGDDVVLDASAPDCLRAWLIVNRLPVADREVLRRAGVWPRLFADFAGARVRLTTVSQLGDVGVSHDHGREYGHDDLVDLGRLSRFGVDP